MAELYKEAKLIESGTRAQKNEDKGDSKEGKRMQDESVKKRYGGMSEQELKVCMCSHPDPSHPDPSHPPPTARAERESAR